MARTKKEPLEETKVEPNEIVKAPQKKASIDGTGVKCDRVEPGSVAERQLIYYASRPKVMTRIMRGAGEKPGAFETVIVNGLRINILKGIQVSLPEEVAQIIDDAFYRTDQAINNTKIPNPFTGQEKPAAVEQQSEFDKQNL